MYVEYGYAHEEASDFTVRTNIGLKVNDETALTAVSDSVLFPHETTSFHIGSHRGELYNMRGFIYEAYYLLDADFLPLNFLTGLDCSDGYDICTAFYSFGLSTCAHNQFISGDDCINCHPSCYQGCVMAGVDNCFDEYYCHPSCRTCDGPEADDCLECYCGLHRSDGKADKSSCECDEGTFGSGCETVCVEGCDVCEGPEEN